MGAPAAVMGDMIQGICATHIAIGPLGAPIPSPPLPFAAQVTIGTCPTVLIAGKPAVVVGAQGMNLPPHVGLHPTDPFLAPPLQMGSVVSGSTSVLLGGVPAARTGDPCLCCAPNQGTLVGSAATVLIGG